MHKRTRAPGWGLAMTSVSVVVASFNARRTIERCLRSLEDQTHRGKLELIVVDSSDDGTGDVVAEHFPSVRLFRLPERVYPGDARNHGVAQARGEIIAFTDADCIVAHDWIEEIVRAQARGHTVVGGVLDNANPGSLVGWAYYLSSFTRWMPGLPPRDLAELPTGCLSVARSVFAECGVFDRGTYSSDTAFSWNAAAQGHSPRFEPAIRVSHVNVEGIATLLLRRLHRGRSFAAVRTRHQPLSLAGRIAHAASAPLLPFALFGRIVRQVVNSRTYRKQLIRSSPLVMAALAAWSLGELTGYLLGPADATFQPLHEEEALERLSRA